MTAKFRSPVVVFVLALCGAYGVGTVIWGLSTWAPGDMEVYWEAAMRIRTGEPLYPSADVPVESAYRYAPWFAVLWVPLTYLPRDIVEFGWSALLLASAALVFILMLRTGTYAGVALAFLVGGFVVIGAKFGNVQPLMVAVLAVGSQRRWGPIAIGLAASLKATPILFVLAYLGRREWLKAAVAIGVSALLVLPMILLGIADYPTAPGWSHSLFAVSVPLFVVVAVASIMAAAWVAWRHPRYAWLAASVAVILALPRYFQYELAYLLVGALASTASHGGDDTTATRA